MWITGCTCPHYTHNFQKNTKIRPFPLLIILCRKGFFIAKFLSAYTERKCGGIFLRNRLVIGAVILFLLAGMFAGQQSMGVSTDAFSVPFSRLSVLIDAGHGGRDGGAVGIKTGKAESGLNLIITLKLKTLLESSGFTVYLTRENENDLCGASYSKNEDMAARRLIIQNLQPDYVVSIHQNSYPSPSPHGAQVFYYPGSETGEAMAKSVQLRLADLADPANKRTVKEADFFMLRQSSNPSILVECGFLSNPEEEEKLWQEDYQNTLTYAIYAGLVSYVYENLPRV